MTGHNSALFIIMRARKLTDKLTTQESIAPCQKLQKKYDEKDKTRSQAVARIADRTASQQTLVPKG